MPNVTLEIPDHMRLIVLMGLSNAEISIRQSLEKAKNEPHTPGADIEAARQVRQLAWLEQAAEKLR